MISDRHGDENAERCVDIRWPLLGTVLYLPWMFSLASRGGVATKSQHARTQANKALATSPGLSEAERKIAPASINIAAVQ